MRTSNDALGPEGTGIGYSKSRFLKNVLKLALKLQSQVAAAAVRGRSLGLGGLSYPLLQVMANPGVTRCNRRTSR